MRCLKCDEPMIHAYVDRWTTTEDEYEPVEYVVSEGFWTCDNCTYTIDEGDDEYVFPENG